MTSNQATSTKQQNHDSVAGGYHRSLVPYMGHLIAFSAGGILGSIDIRFAILVSAAWFFAGMVFRLGRASGGVQE